MTCSSSFPATAVLGEHTSHRMRKPPSRGAGRIQEGRTNICYGFMSLSQLPHAVRTGH